MDARQPLPEAADSRPAAGYGQPESQTPPRAPDPAALSCAPVGEQSLAELRQILARPDRELSTALEARVATLEHRTGDSSELIEAISPLMGDMIRRNIQDSRDEMIEALYPIIGQLISRAVAEAIRDLVRTIDARMRPSFSPEGIFRRLRARRAGIPDAALALRDALPFQVTELFLVHRESGLLLLHLSNLPEQTDQADLVSGMLTAIRDFVQDAFGRGQEGQLDEIQYGTKRILIEATRHAYLAAVVEGIEPAGFRAALREQIITIENDYSDALVHYDGDATHFTAAKPDLVTLMAASDNTEPAPPTGLNAGQRRILIGLAALITLCLLATCLGSILAVRRTLNRPATMVMIVVTATPGPTFTATRTPAPPPTPLPSPSPTATPAPTATATATRTAVPASPTPAPSPVARIVEAQINLRSGPGLNYGVLEVVEQGRALTVVGRNATGGWWQVCCTQNGASGWVASALVQLEGTLLDVPVTAGE